ncbi:MAG TPA: GNAT family N-acetyltransferase [Actinomycetota bacterium]
MRLRNLTTEDLWLYEAIHCDSRMMEHLGGPLPKAGLAEKLERDAAATEADEVWVLVIVLEEETAAGTVSIWEHEVGGELLTEIGWMVLPDHQGKGVGSAGVRMALDRARETGRWDVLHAFPPVSNLASNAMCRTLGFTLLGERTNRFRDRQLRVNHWRLDLRSA